MNVFIPKPVFRIKVPKSIFVICPIQIKVNGSVLSSLKYLWWHDILKRLFKRCVSQGFSLLFIKRREKKTKKKKRIEQGWECNIYTSEILKQLCCLQFVGRYLKFGGFQSHVSYNLPKKDSSSDWFCQSITIIGNNYFCNSLQF